VHWGQQAHSFEMLLTIVDKIDKLLLQIVLMHKVYTFNQMESKVDDLAKRNYDISKQAYAEFSI
jgi:hypothetical protein